MLRATFDRLGRHGYILAVAAVALSTLVFYPGRDHFAKGQWAILYLLVVVLVAGLSGTRPAILAAVLAFFCWNYFFLPPYHALHVADTEDWLSLVAFLVAGIVMGAQTGRLREREARAVAREREAAAINRLSTYLVSEVPTATVADTLLVETVRLLGAERAALFLPGDDGRLRPVAAAPEDAPGPGPSVEAAAAWCLANNQALGLPGLPREDDESSSRPVPPEGPPRKTRSTAPAPTSLCRRPRARTACSTSRPPVPATGRRPSLPCWTHSPTSRPRSSRVSACRPR